MAKFVVDGVEVEVVKKSEKKYGTWMEIWVNGVKIFTFEPYDSFGGSPAVVIETRGMATFRDAKWIGGETRIDIVSYEG